VPEEPQYTEITLLVHSEAVEGLVDVLLASGAKGVVEEPQIPTVRLTAYVPEDGRLEQRVKAIHARLSALQAAGLRTGPGSIGLRTVGTEAWSEAWKDHFQVQRVAPSLVLAPSWEHYQPQPGETVVILDPGPAFGTGGHATTRLCLRALAEHIRPRDRVADVGCGSGILAVAAALLGASQVLATDDDPTALPVARQNAKRNHVAGVVRVMEADLLPGNAGPFDLIVCNIVSSEVVRLAERLPLLLAPGGRFIGSGFLSTTLPVVEDALTRAGLRLLTTPSEEGWAACVAVRPGRVC
jgi:ribosomal protein L11 methyltransferase